MYIHRIRFINLRRYRTSSIKASGWIVGLGRDFILYVTLENISATKIATNLYIIIHADPSLYKIEKRFVELSPIVPGEVLNTRNLEITLVNCFLIRIFSKNGLWCEFTFKTWKITSGIVIWYINHTCSYHERRIIKTVNCFNSCHATTWTSNVRYLLDNPFTICPAIKLHIIKFKWKERCSQNHKIGTYLHINKIIFLLFIYLLKNSWISVM